VGRGEEKNKKKAGVVEHGKPVLEMITEKNGGKFSMVSVKKRRK